VPFVRKKVRSRASPTQIVGIRGDERSADAVSPPSGTPRGGEEMVGPGCASTKVPPPPADPRETSMSKKYEIHSGRRVVSTQVSVSASQAVIDYVRSYGVKDDEITRLGVDSVSWRGAQFKAMLIVPTEPQAG